MKTLILLILSAATLQAHDAFGRTSAPPESRRLKNPLASSEAVLFQAGATYTRLCSSCHGPDGKARTKLAGTLPTRPTDLTNYLMKSMKDGEIYWIVTNGVDGKMPAFTGQLSEVQRWELVHWVRELRVRQLYKERIQLGTYEWNLPPGFPFPNVPSDNLMTAAKVELGRHLFYDRRLSLNQKQSCATCHEQDKAFADHRPRALGSTGELHPRGAMSLINVAYAPALTWANPNLRKLEQQALSPIFGDHPVELGMTGKEELLIGRLKAEPRYQKLFPDAFPGEAAAFTLGNITKAIASFERTLLAGNSPFDEYRRGDDRDAISASAKRGESLFFSERLECFHCHGGFNFTGSIDYLGKANAELEFHNTGLYNLKGKLSYPPDNTGLYEFTQASDDIGKFKAPTLRNIALTAPYMHDGSIKTLAEAIEHYRVGGRSIQAGPLAGIGFANPNKSLFLKSFELSASEKQDLLSFLRSLTDSSIATTQQWSDPWQPAHLSGNTKALPFRHVLSGIVIAVYPEDGSITLHHDAVPGFLSATTKPATREVLVPNRRDLLNLKPGTRIHAAIRKRGNDYVLEQITIQ